MIVRWLIGVCLLATIAQGSLLDDVDNNILKSGRNVTEKTGQACAFADFNQDRLTDVLHYHKGKLFVLVQQQRDFAGEDSEEAKNYNMFLGDDWDDFSEVACSVGDVNGDGLADVVVSIKNKNNNGHWDLKYFLSEEKPGEKDDNGRVKYKFVEYTTAARKTAKHQVALIDVTGDGIHDLVGVQEGEDNKQEMMLCLTMDTDKNTPLTKACEGLFGKPEEFGKLQPLMPILYGDVNNDRYAELIFMKFDENKRLRPEIWERHLGPLIDKGWRKSDSQLPELPSTVNFEHTLAPLLVDLDLNARMDFVVPICKDKTCTQIDSLQAIEWLPADENNAARWGPWRPIGVEMQSQTIVEEPDTLVRMKAGDANLDGYPDLLVTLGSANGPNNYAAVLESKFSEESGTVKFEKGSQMMIMPGLALGMIQSSSFFDFAEDGLLDVLVQWKLRDGADWQWSLCISKSDKQGDVTFLKVQTFAPLLDGDIQYGKGVVWGGTCVTYEMETTGIGEKRRAIECQVPGNSHKAGLTPPFTLFGLGRTPNFIDQAEIGVPRASTDDNIRRHVQKQIVPNARMMVQPPLSSANGWVLRLYLTPSTLIYSSLIVMASTCTILLIVVLILHFREKKVDRVERAAQSHRFHFDAM